MPAINNPRVLELNRALHDAHRRGDTAEVARLSDEIAGLLDEHLGGIRTTIDDTRANINSGIVEQQRRRTNTYRDLILLYRECITLAREISTIKKFLREQKKRGGA